MNELAQQLAAAGFPYKEPADHPYVPPLEELLLACGEGVIVCEYAGEEGERLWYAGKIERHTYFVAGVIDGDIDNLQSGASPTEAVANLWLALNPK